MEVVPFKAEHLKQLRLQGAQAYLSGWVTEDSGRALEQTLAYTGVVNGVPIGIAGVLPQWPHRAIAWSFLSETGPKNFLKVHRAIKRFLDGYYVHRLEITVDTDFDAGHRWAEMLGFEMEAYRMRAYAPDGHDCSLYARVL